MKNILYKRLKKTRIIQAKYYDENHIFKSYNVKNKILLNSKHIKTTKSYKKLDYKYLKSFEIELSIDKQAYRLRFSKSFKSIHNVFHVFLLKSYRERFDVTSSSFSTLQDEEKHFEIENILNSRMRYDKLEYLIK